MVARRFVFATLGAVTMTVAVWAVSACSTQSSSAPDSSPSGDAVPCRNGAAEQLSSIDGQPCEANSELCEQQVSADPCSATTRCTCDSFGKGNTWHCGTSGPAFSCGQTSGSSTTQDAAQPSNDAASDAAPSDAGAGG